jgi:hypothetical protein
MQVEEALEYLRAAGITGAAKYAAGSVFCCVDEAQKIPPALEREAEVVLLKVSEAWTKLVSLPPGSGPCLSLCITCYRSCPCAVLENALFVWPLHDLHFLCVIGCTVAQSAHHSALQSH